MNQARERAVHATLEALGLIDAAAGARVIAAVAGGINKTARVEIRDRMLFAKWNDRGLRAHFSAEAAGLEALRAADSGLRVPTVIAHRDEPATEAFLLLEHIENVNRPAEFDETLGRGLARLHRTSSRSLDAWCRSYNASLQICLRPLASFLVARILITFHCRRLRGRRGREKL